MIDTQSSEALDDAVSAVLAAHEQLEPTAYDEAFDEVSARIADRGHLTKADIGALVCRKRLNASTTWVRRLMATPESEVVAVTQRMVQAIRAPGDVLAAARAARSELSVLPGFRIGDAVASATISTTDPTRMAVYDRRAHQAITQLGLILSHKPGRYARYMAIIDELQAGCARRGTEVGAHQVDVALFSTGG